LRDTAVGSSLNDFGFKFEENPIGFKAKLRQFFTTQLEKGKKILEEKAKALRSIESGAALPESTVGKYLSPSFPSRSTCYNWLRSSLKETIEGDRRGQCPTVQLDAMPKAIETRQMRHTLDSPKDFSQSETQEGHNAVTSLMWKLGPSERFS